MVCDELQWNLISISQVKAVSRPCPVPKAFNIRGKQEGSICRNGEPIFSGEFTFQLIWTPASIAKKQNKFLGAVFGT